MEALNKYVFAYFSWWPAWMTRWMSLWGHGWQKTGSEYLWACTAHADLIDIHKGYIQTLLLFSFQFMMACMVVMVKEFMRTWMWKTWSLISFWGSTAHADLIDMHKGYKQTLIFLSFHGGLLGGQGEGVHEEGGVGERKKWIFLESLTFYPTYLKIDTLASKTKKWEGICFRHSLIGLPINW